MLCGEIGYDYNKSGKDTEIVVKSYNTYTVCESIYLYTKHCHRHFM